MKRLRPPRDRRGQFVNWARTIKAAPSSWREPAREEEVIAIVRDAARAGKQVRVVGAGHSWSPIAAPTEGHVAVSLDRMAGIVRANAGTITVGAGARLRELNAALAERGLALPIVGSIAHQTVAGAIATGTHGSSLVHGNLSSLVDGVRLVTGRGDLLDLGRDDQRLDGARLHLGALGALTQVTLRVVPSFRLVEVSETVSLAHACANLESIARSAEYVKVWWLPHTRTALVFRYARTDERASRNAVSARWLDERIVQGMILPCAFAVHAWRPGSIPAWNRTVVRLYEGRRPRVAASPLCLSTPMPARHRETEAAVPLAHAGQAFERLIRLIDDERVRVNFIVEVRFVRADTGWLSPAFGGDVAQIGAYMSATSETDRYFAAFWRMARALCGRPHWGKEMSHSADEIRALWPMAQRFAALRDQMDPDRVFGGPFHERALGP